MKTLALLLSCLVASSAFATTVEETALRAHLSLVSSDLFEGRGTGQRGGDLTVAYLEAQARAVGLQGINGQSMLQPVHLTGVKTLAQQSDVQLHIQGQPFGLKFAEDWVYQHGHAQIQQTLASELVFVGYGIVAKEEGWDDYQGLNCAGKTLLMLAGEPVPTATRPQRFAGESMTIYSRKNYKVEQARRCGAAAAIIIHDPSISAWSQFQDRAEGENFQLTGINKSPAWHATLNLPAAQRVLHSLGLDLGQLKTRAAIANQAPLALAARLTGTSRATVRELTQYNVVALLPGSDPILRDEVVVYSAHWDHLGIQSDAQGTDKIFNGAVDNGTGIASVLAMAKVAPPAKRSQLFVWLAAEEHGLLGSAAFVHNPPWPADKIVAALNVDTMNFAGKTRDIGLAGAERSDLFAIASEVARDMHLQVAAPRPDTGGYYFRSDHYSFAAAGIPAFSVGKGREYLNPAAAPIASGFGKRYHQANDEYDSSWDLSGLQQQAQFTLNLGQAIANRPDAPNWKAEQSFQRPAN